MPQPPLTASTTEETSVRRRVPDFFIDAFPLLLLAAAMVSFDRWFSFINDEVTALASSVRPASAILGDFLGASTRHAHPPLYELILHLWLVATGGAANWLRAPAITFYVVGIWFLSRAARRLGGIESGTAMVWLGVLWPYGFHFGRVAGWYSFSFFLVCGLTWSYLRYCNATGQREWISICLFAIALVYTTYVGWAVLALLGFDYWLRNRGKRGPYAKNLLYVGAVVAAAYAPVWPSFLRELGRGVQLHQSPKALILNLAYCVYALVVSPSVAPWIWKLGVPAAAGVAASFLLVFVAVGEELRRLMILGGLLIVGMGLTGILQSDHLFPVAPWLILPVAVGLGTLTDRYMRTGLVLALIAGAGIGWYGTYNRTYYASPRFVEPWGEIAVQASAATRAGVVVISNSPPLFFYMTYALRMPPGNPWVFQGVLPEQVTHALIWNPADWATAGEPVSQRVLWIRGESTTAQNKALQDAGAWLDSHCGDRTVQYLAPDLGYEWRERLFPQTGADVWAMEIRDYNCSSQAPAPSGEANKPSNTTPGTQ